MNSIRYTEWIDSYVEGELDEAGMRQFEEELEINRNLALEYKLDKDINEALLEEDILDLRAKCMTAQNEYNLSRSRLARVVQFTRKYWYAAASVILIGLIAGGLMLMNPGGYSSEKLFKMYYKSDPSVGISRSGNVNMVEALRVFSMNDFKAADKLFDKVLETDPGNIPVKYYSGISNIENRNFEKAIAMFEDIISDGDNLYVENAQWYLGLSQLAAGKINEAVEIFGIISRKQDHFYHKDAESILEKINKSGNNKNILNKLFFLILPF
ncbi:MAG: hypothetical protein KBC43_04110 [Bacteroidales bacterium]|nr:hypothetical protein [Bacteroidales bacterium]